MDCGESNNSGVISGLAKLIKLMTFSRGAISLDNPLKSVRPCSST